jgi:protein-S-isoprenylcysteine O-methyltransferase Ste14
MQDKQQQRASLRIVQLVRKTALLFTFIIVLCLMSVVASIWERQSITHRAIEWTGLSLILICVLGRTWCSMYIGGRKLRKLVLDGPYSISRNPLYLFTFLGAAGMAMQDGSMTLGITAALITWLIFIIVVQKEENVLASIFGEQYNQYVKNVPQFLPNLWLFHDLETVEIRPKYVRRTLMDALLFLLSVPVFRAFEYLQDIKILPVLIRLP